MESTRAKEIQMSEATIRTIDVPGAVLAYDIRPGSDADSSRW